MAVNDRTLNLLDNYRVAIAALTDQTAQELAGAWVTAWDNVAGDLEQAALDITTASAGGRVTTAQLARHARLAEALDLIAAELEGVAARSGVIITTAVPRAVDLGGLAAADLLRSQLPPGESGLVTGWDRVDPRSVEAIVNRTAQRITASTLPLSTDGQAAIRHYLVRGIAVGDNPRAVARRMVRGTQTLFEGGYARAERIARTEMMDAHRAANQATNLANSDITDGWEWVATLGRRTCSACWSMHGQRFPATTPGPQGHPNCRCTAVPALKSWEDLNFPDLVEPPSLLPDNATAFASLTPEEQRAILGPKRFTAWTEGNYPMERWATLKDNPDWRPSWVPTTAPAAA